MTTTTMGLSPNIQISAEVDHLLYRLLPRTLNPKAGDETVTLIHSILTQAHLDRRSAREFGWRGVRPSFTHHPAWTARIAGRDVIFGLVFDEEAVHESELLLGSLRLFAFPDPNHPTLACRPTAMQEEIRSPVWPHRIRALSEQVDELEPYQVGDIEFGVRLDGTGVELTLTALREETLNNEIGDIIGHIRPLTEGLPFFTALAETLRASLPNGTLTENVLWAEPDTEHNTLQVSITMAAGCFVGLLPGHRMHHLPFKHRPHADELMHKPIVHVLSGFLGAGKTTFLQHWLEFLNNRERFTGVIQNEFGEVDLDTLLLKGQTRVEAIDEGCVCCTLADSLRPGLLRLLEASPADQIIIETTGLAHASLVMDSLWVLNDIVTRGLLITVVDAYDFSHHPNTLDDNHLSEEAQCRRNQIDHADVLICAKADAVTDEALEALQNRLAQRNPQALILAADHGAVPFGILDAFFLHAFDRHNGHLTSRDRNTQTQANSVPAFTRPGRWHLPNQSLAQTHNTDFETFTIEVPEDRSVESWRQLIKTVGSGVARAKGIVGLTGHGTVILQYAAETLDFQPLPVDNQSSVAQNKPIERFLVFIGHHLKQPT